MSTSVEQVDTDSAETDREVIDFGGHFYTNLVPFRPDRFDTFDDLVGPAYSDPDAYIDRITGGGITGSVLVAPLYIQRGFELERQSEANDILRDIVESHDEFVGSLASIPFDKAGEEAAAEFERSLENGHNGGVIDTINNDGVELVDAELEPVFEVADRTGAPIMVHPRAGSSMDPDHDVLTDRYRNNSIFGREVTLMDSICKVIHEGVLDRYPNLNLVYDHTGGNIASNLGRIEYQLDKDRWPGDHEHIKGWEEFRAQLEERIYIKMSGYYGYHAPLRATLEEFPADHVLFGTDFPMEVRTSEELADLVETVDDLTGLTDGNRILSQNTRDLLVNLD